MREDEVSAGSQPSERIFAGGVGPGADGLSAFTLRVYDSATGRSPWEGLLNLSAGDQEPSSTHRVVAHLDAPQATVTQVLSQGAIDGQPQFFLRTVDSVTGQLVWTDQFSAGAGTVARAERVGRAAVGQTEELAALSQQIEFRIRMMDDLTQQILGEDTIEPTVEETDIVAEHDDAAENLPVWRGGAPEEMKKRSDLINLSFRAPVTDPPTGLQLLERQRELRLHGGRERPPRLEVCEEFFYPRHAEAVDQIVHGRVRLHIGHGCGFTGQPSPRSL